MKVKNSISTTMRTLKGRETKDKAAKNIFSYKPIMGNILKYTVAENSICRGRHGRKHPGRTDGIQHNR